MKNLLKSGWGGLAAVALLGLVLSAVALRASRSEPAAPERSGRPGAPKVAASPGPVIVAAPKFVAAPPEKLAAATNDSALTTMIDNYLVACARRDAATQQAMLSGLQRQPARSAELLAARRKGMDPGSALAVDRALQELQVIK
jgi:hypothetical protein